jgi:hypothetical protein
MINVWRVRMLSQADGIDVVAARNFAVENGIVGAGWSVADASEPNPLPDLSTDLDAYVRHAKSAHPKDNSVEAVARVFATQMQIGDFCWMYVSHTGEYYCCKIDGEFRYRVGGNWDKHDLHLTRHCVWSKAGPADAVPGVVRRAFAGPFGTVSRLTTDADTAIQAAQIYLGDKHAPLGGDFFASASPEDLEDVFALYLQEQGWRVFPSTAKVSMASYEFVLVHCATGRHAGVQVKSGKVSFLEPYVADDFDEFFVLMANPNAIVAGTDSRITRINRDEIEAFAQLNWALLPRRLKARWPIS